MESSEEICSRLYRSVPLFVIPFTGALLDMLLQACLTRTFFILVNLKSLLFSFELFLLHKSKIQRHFKDDLSEDLHQAHGRHQMTLGSKSVGDFQTLEI